MSSVKPPAQSCEFTKRKRWAETLFSEISETLILIVSPSFKVLYCGAAIVELLGWKEDQLVDADLSAIINSMFT
ncbi:MAG TPA: PAS domain-containing protein [Chlamydiales bacterium]|nr:PAS domain-containing protein [Chlamydiales bacterium]